MKIGRLRAGLVAAASLPSVIAEEMSVGVNHGSLDSRFREVISNELRTIIGSPNLEELMNNSDVSTGLRAPLPAANSQRRSTRRTPDLAISARRTFLKAAVVVGLGLPLIDEAIADESTAANERPQEGDHFVFAEGEQEGKEIRPGDLSLGGPQLMAWPKDPKSGVVRDGSRLNQVVLLRLDPASLDDETRPHAADGIVAYSAICTHAQCPVNGWLEEHGRHVLKCFCHNSEFDPRLAGKVVSGPAPKQLPALPVSINGGALIAAGTFLGRVGLRPS